MQITVATRAPASRSNDCRLVGVHADGPPIGGARALERASDGAIGRAKARGDFRARIGDTLMLHELPGAGAERVLLIGLGRRDDLDDDGWARICEASAAALRASGTRHAWGDVAAVVATTPETVARRSARLARAVALATWRFDGHARRERSPGPALEHLVLIVPKRAADAAALAVERAAATAEGMARARHLADLAPNLCTPAHLADTARAMAEEHAALSVEVLDEGDMEALGMHAFLAVSRGSGQPGCLIAMSWRGAPRRAAPVVLLGKGVTFDSGGISIKPSASMDEMKYDMGGAAAVFGAIDACCRLGLPIDVTGVVVAAENMPDGGASRPGDVIVSMSGQSIEILNTDAEGRLVLADALTWIERLKPRAVVDVATLTGACVVALGEVASGAFGNDETLLDALVAAGREADDAAWPMPMLPAYRRQLDSSFADMANIGGKGAGAVTAACFLARFAEAYPWAHLDVAGTAWRSGTAKGATGRPVPLLMQYLFDRVDARRSSAP